jgi:hypothetical protein
MLHQVERLAKEHYYNGESVTMKNKRFLNYDNSFISVVYGMIYVYLSRYRLVRDDNPADLEKVRRTNVMLVSIL